MLYTGVNHFNWTANNFSDLHPGNAAATQLTAHADPHTKGSDTACMVGVAYDVFGIALTVTAGSTDATIRRQMIDLLIDSSAGVGNAGSSWSVAINNLFCNGPTMNSNMQGFNFYFPLFLPAGTAIGARVQDVVGAATCRLSIEVFGQPSNPESLKVGQVVETIGATTASTSGVAVTPGNGSMGSYSASLGTLTRPSWWWQLGVGSNDVTMTGNLIFFDIAEDATAKYICAQRIKYNCNTSEQAGKEAFGNRLPIHHAAAGQDVYVRGIGLGAPDGSTTAVVYAVS